MKKLLVLGAAALLSTTSSAAMAADLVPFEPPVQVMEASGFYLKGQVGWTFMDTSLPVNDDAFSAGLGIGYTLNNMFRVDLTGDYSGAYDIGLANNLNVWTLLGNAYVSVPIFESLSPFVGLGLGWGWVDSGGGDGLTLAAHAGITFAVTERLNFDLSYRFRDIMIKGPDFMDHAVLAGFRVGF